MGPPQVISNTIISTNSVVNQECAAKTFVKKRPANDATSDDLHHCDRQPVSLLLKEAVPVHDVRSALVVLSQPPQSVVGRVETQDRRDSPCEARCTVIALKLKQGLDGSTKKLISIVDLILLTGSPE